MCGISEYTDMSTFFSSGDFSARLRSNNSFVTSGWVFHNKWTCPLAKKKQKNKKDSVMSLTVWFHRGCVYISALFAFNWSWHLACSCTIGLMTKEWWPSGINNLDVVGGVEADLAVAQLTFTPALLIFLSHLQQLLTWKHCTLYTEWKAALIIMTYNTFIGDLVLAK